MFLELHQLEDLNCDIKAGKMPWLVARHTAETNSALSVTVVFPVLGMPDKLCEFPGNSIVFSVLKGHYKNTSSHCC